MFGVDLLAVLLVGAACVAIRESGARLSTEALDLVKVSAGSYWVGGEQAAANPRRKQWVKTFWIASTETTNREFAAFVEATGYITDAERSGYGLVSRPGMKDWVWTKEEGASWRFPQGRDHDGFADLLDHPVTQISARDAEAYCLWAGGRLPSLEEWEIAARAGVAAPYPWGGASPAESPNLANVWQGGSHQAISEADGYIYTAPVRSYPPNAWGLYDVIGNVFEYCSGEPTSFVDRTDLMPMTASRGGSWWCSASTCQYYNLEDVGMTNAFAGFSNTGFRIVFDQEHRLAGDGVWAGGYDSI